jgi:hypothetical protein
VLDHQAGLACPLNDHPPALPEELAIFPERFAELGSPWSVQAADEIFDLGGEGYAVPDLRFDHQLGGEPAWLELIGYWRSHGAQNHLARLATHGPQRYLVAVSRGLCVDDAPPTLGQGRDVLLFRHALRPRDVLRSLEAIH